MSLKKGQNKNQNCPRCNITMVQILQRSYGDIGFLFECPKCKGLIQK